MRLYLAVLLLSCAVDPEPTSKTTPPPIPTTLTIYERLHDGAGPVHGLAGFQRVHRVDANHCTGIAVTLERTNAPVASEDALLAEYFAVPFPSGLDFEPTSKEKKEKSLNRFNDFVQTMTKRGQAAREAYSARIESKASTKNERIVAAARIVQMHRHFASLLVRAEIPLDVRSGEFARDKIGAFCERMEEVAEGLLITSEGAAKMCAEHANGMQPGWWSKVCTFAGATVTASAAPSSSR